VLLCGYTGGPESFQTFAYGIDSGMSSIPQGVYLKQIIGRIFRKPEMAGQSPLAIAKKQRSGD
jgi:hypothetical protein